MAPSQRKPSSPLNIHIHPPTPSPSSSRSPSLSSTPNLTTSSLSLSTPNPRTRPRTPHPPPADPTDDPSYTRPLKQANVTFYEDREQRGIAELLTRYRAIVTAIPMISEDGGSKATRESAGSVALNMEVEAAALVKAAEDLLRLSRELKELWLFGPLRDIGEGEGEGKMDEDSVKVGALLDDILREDLEREESRLLGA